MSPEVTISITAAAVAYTTINVDVLILAVVTTLKLHALDEAVFLVLIQSSFVENVADLKIFAFDRTLVVNDKAFVAGDG